MKKIVCEELYLFANRQTSRSILPSFRHNFDIFINYQQQFIVFFGENRSVTKPKHSQKYSSNLLCLYKSLRQVRNPLILRQLHQCRYCLHWVQNNLSKHFEPYDNHTHEQYYLLEAFLLLASNKVGFYSVLLSFATLVQINCKIATTA